VVKSCFACWHEAGESSLVALENAFTLVFLFLKLRPIFRKRTANGSHVPVTAVTDTMWKQAGTLQVAAPSRDTIEVLRSLCMEGPCRDSIQSN
jgi:hypothetical protein